LNHVEVLGVSIACLDVNGLMSFVLDWSSSEQKRTIFYVNAHCLNLAYEDRKFQDLINSADLVYTDGISVVWASRLFHGCQLHKMTGADWIDRFAISASQAGLRVYLLAGKPGVARLAAHRLVKSYPNLQIVGTCDGYFTEKDEQKVLEEIRLKKPHVVFVGMGTTAQENWIRLHRSEIDAPVCWAVGALFDFVAGIEPRVPRWMNALALEWLWRWMMDPVGKWRRYLVGNPLYIYRILRFWLSQKL
jgi:N-acetylglucosaminyldiphosphoundecaprenol N-acetyl-beta-D-mannosaminyltransferase